MLYIGYHKGTIDDGYICSSKYMLEQYNERPEDFSRVIIAQGTKVDMHALEVAILESVNAKDNKDFYNRSNSYNNFVFISHSDESKQKMSKTRKRRGLAIGENNGMFGRTHTPETRQKLSLANKGKKNPHSEEHCKKLSYPKPKEHKLKISQALKGKTKSEKHRENLSLSLTGRTIRKASCYKCRCEMGINNIKKHYSVCLGVKNAD